MAMRVLFIKKASRQQQYLIRPQRDETCLAPTRAHVCPVIYVLDCLGVIKAI